jgi:hypothetical protein
VGNLEAMHVPGHQWEVHFCRHQFLAITFLLQLCQQTVKILLSVHFLQFIVPVLCVVIGAVPNFACNVAPTISMFVVKLQKLMVFMCCPRLLSFLSVDHEVLSIIFATLTGTSYLFPIIHDVIYLRSQNGPLNRSVLFNMCLYHFVFFLQPMLSADVGCVSTLVNSLSPLHLFMDCKPSQLPNFLHKLLRMNQNENSFIV